MPERPRHPGRGIALVLAAVLVFCCLDTTSKHLATRYPLPMLIWARYTVQLLLMVVLLAPSHRGALFKTQRLPAQVGRALILMVVTACVIAALRILPLAEATALAYTSPLLAALLAGPFLGEKLDTRRWLALGAGFVGVLFIARPGGAITGEGLFYALSGAVCYAAYQVMTRKLGATESSVSLLFYTAMVGSLASTLALPWIDLNALPTGMDLLWTLCLGLFGGLGHFLLIRAYHHAPVGTIGPFLYAQLMWATLVGWLIFGQFPDHWSLIGMAIIAISGLMVAFGKKAAA